MVGISVLNVIPNPLTADVVLKSDAVAQKRIDVILDKISKSGYENLSKDEKDFLFKAGKK